MRSEVKKVLVSGETTLREALRLLCENARQVLFVVKDGKLRGALSDGDVRRFLLGGGDLEAPVSAAANSNARFLFDTERRNAEKVIWESCISAVPIVDENMNVVDAVFLHESVDLDKVVIRQLRPDDLPMVMEFFDQMSGDTRAMFNRNDANRMRVIDHLKRKAEDNQVHFAAVVADPDGSEKMVGYVFLWDTDRKIPWLGIAVREDWKGRHLGRRLLEHLDAYAEPRGYGGLMLTSVPANVRAHSLYSHMGFEYMGVYCDGEFLYVKRYDLTRDGR